MGCFFSPGRATPGRGRRLGGAREPPPGRGFGTWTVNKGGRGRTDPPTVFIKHARGAPGHPLCFIENVYFAEVWPAPHPRRATPSSTGLPILPLPDPPFPSQWASACMLAAGRWGSAGDVAFSRKAHETDKPFFCSSEANENGHINSLVERKNVLSMFRDREEAPPHALSNPPAQ